ncbi:MAG: hypothetical protein K8F36_03805 [Melioribacteraceae bacterium]|nr:hypothetical protein [Melioribacteraceae bacterium]
MMTGARVMERSGMYREHKASAENEVMIEMTGSLDASTSSAQVRSQKA